VFNQRTLAWSLTFSLIFSLISLWILKRPAPPPEELLSNLPEESWIGYQIVIPPPPPPMRRKEDEETKYRVVYHQQEKQARGYILEFSPRKYLQQIRLFEAADFPAEWTDLVQMGFFKPNQDPPLATSGLCSIRCAYQGKEYAYDTVLAPQRFEYQEANALLLRQGESSEGRLYRISKREDLDEMKDEELKTRLLEEIRKTESINEHLREFRTS
jgi:hypothetical protein